MSTAAIPLGGRGRRRTLRRIGWGLGGVPLLLLTFVVVVTASTANLCAPQTSGAAKVSAPSKEALADIPGDYLRAYVAAGEKYGLDWAIIAGIGSIETDHGRLDAPGVTSGQNRHGCCAGPMQFHNGYGSNASNTTWGAYGVDGNGDGTKDIYDPADAVPSAANYLRASGAPQNWQRAIFAYNRAQWYVDDVLGRAARYRSAAAAAGGITSIPVAATDAATTGGGFSCAAPASASGSAGDVTAAVDPWMGKTWGEALAAGMKRLGWPDGTPWCQVFVQNVLAKLGIDRPTPNSGHSSDPYDWAVGPEKWGTVLHGPDKAASASLQLQPGDIVMYGPPYDASSHVNMVEKVDDRGVITVGGNQSCPKGSCVTRRGPVRLTGAGGSLRWNTGDTRPIWAIVRPPAPKGVRA